MADNLMGLSQYNIDDGFFEISFEAQGVFLSVYPPVKKGSRVGIDEVIKKLNNKKIKSFSRSSIDIAVQKADKLPVKVADPQPEEKVDAIASVMISLDKMKAFVSIIPPEGGRMLTIEELILTLRRSYVIFGISKSALESIINNPVYNEMVCVAEGIPPVNGQNGKVEFYFDVSKERKPSVLEDGRVDFRELNLIDSVSKGQKLCSLIEPIPGIPGKMVTGIDVPATSGKPGSFHRGRNVEISKDDMYLLSSIDGQVILIEDKVTVFASYEVKADVDNSTGNISFVGNVSVRGNVLSGFVIEAGGNIEVWGVVESATLKADGDIILKRGMQGLGKGMLISGGDIIARYIEHSNLEAKNNITAEAIMHSNVKCGNKLELGGKKGLLVGGNSKVGKEIIAKVIGSHMATATEIEVGIDPTLRERYKVVREELTNSENDVKKADQAIVILKKLEAANMLTPDKQEMMTKSVRTKVFLSVQINELKDELVQLERKLQQEANGRIKARNFIYPGTKVSIGTSLMVVKDNLQFCTLYKDGADVKVGPYDK